MDFFLDALPALGSAFSQILQPIVLGYLSLGVVMGLCIGVFPGLGGIAGLSLLLPFMFGMDPILGLALMIGMVAVVPTSDTFASVLMGIPGSSASQATVLDGFPMARKGLAARALSAAFTSSLVGGLIGAAEGIQAIPEAMVDAVLNCDTNKGKHPRPSFLHPQQVPTLIDALLNK